METAMTVQRVSVLANREKNVLRAVVIPRYSVPAVSSKYALPEPSAMGGGFSVRDEEEDYGDRMLSRT